MVAIVHSAALTGFYGQLIEVETDARAGLPGLQIVGMGNKAIDEARERVRSAIRNADLDFPTKKLTVNLAPAELPKHGTHFDLPIALSILVSSGQILPRELKNTLFAGELALDGRLRTIQGAVSIAETAQKAGFSRVILPLDNVNQARLVPGITIQGATNLNELFRHLKSGMPLGEGTATPVEYSSPGPTLDDIKGHETAKRALLITAAGRHNLLLTGSPGAGKTLLAQTLPSLLPDLSPQESLEATKLHDLHRGEAATIMKRPPFRAPHHSTTPIAIIGGGTPPLPGEISLAHTGTLFLDEFPEFPRATLESLRQPLENHTVTIHRGNRTITYPARTLLVAAMNPCPCGYLGDSQKSCTCLQYRIEQYRKRVSGPLLDRFDLRLVVPRVDVKKLTQAESASEKQHPKVLTLAEEARKRQFERYKSCSTYNAYASPATIDEHFFPAPTATLFLQKAATKLALSTRAYYRTLRVARTIADLESSQTIEMQHVAEALQFRANP